VFSASVQRASKGLWRSNRIVAIAEGAHPEDARAGEFEQGRRGWKKYGCLIPVSKNVCARSTRLSVKQCELQEYNFAPDRWFSKDTAPDAVPPKLAAHFSRYPRRREAASRISRHVQRRVISATVRLDDDFNILIEGHEEPQQAFDGERPEIAAEHFRDIGLLDAEQIGGRGLFQTALFHDAVDLEDKLGLDQMLIGVLHTEILEHVPASGLISFFIAHGCLSLLSVRPRAAVA
jgi:hypothetical protein